jgi:hypothetical protein
MLFCLIKTVLNVSIYFKEIILDLKNQEERIYSSDILYLVKSALFDPLPFLTSCLKLNKTQIVSIDFAQFATLTASFSFFKKLLSHHPPILSISMNHPIKKCLWNLYF